MTLDRMARRRLRELETQAELTHAERRLRAALRKADTKLNRENELRAGLGLDPLTRADD